MGMETNKCEFHSTAARMNQPWLHTALGDKLAGLVGVRAAKALSLHAMGEENFLGKSRSTVTKKKKKGKSMVDN